MPPPPHRVAALRPLRRLLAAAAFVALGAAAVANAAPLTPRSVPLRFSLCGPDNLGIRSIRLNQWPVRPGSDLVITADYTPRVNVTGGTAHATVHVLGFPLTETRDVCHEPGVSCPILAGKPITSVIRDHVPALTPSLAVDVRVAIADQEGRPLTCVATRVDIESRPLVSPLAYQILQAMDQYLRMRPASPRDTPLLRGGGQSGRQKEGEGGLRR